MAFFNSAVTVLQTLVIALGAGLGIWGAINLLEGYGNDNPGAKSQGMKQLMAGGGVALIGTTLVPLLSGCSVKRKLSERRFRPGGESCLLHSQVQAISAAGYFLRSPAGAHVGSLAQNRSLESHRLIGRTSYRRTNLWRFLLQLHRHCLFSHSCSCFCPGWRSCSVCLRKEGGGSCRVSLNRSQIGSRA